MPRSTLTKTERRTIPQRVQKLLDGFGWTQRQLADEIGARQPAVSAYINGNTVPSGPAMVHIERLEAILARRAAR